MDLALLCGLCSFVCFSFDHCLGPYVSDFLFLFGYVVSKLLAHLGELLFPRPMFIYLLIFCSLALKNYVHSFEGNILAYHFYVYIFY